MIDSSKDSKVDISSKKKVHFMGIGGSGMNAAAILAKLNGFKVSGCDLEANTDYLKRVKDEGIMVYQGHSKDHIKKGDILVVSPAVIYLNPEHPECKKGSIDGKLTTWHEFIGKNILKHKKVIGVTGTHGKSTTTAMVGSLLENAGLDPSVFVGAKVKRWKGNLRVGKSKYFVIEADDFYEKFIDYHVDIAVINNIEYDHPDFFKSEEHMLSVYEKFLKTIPSDGVVIYNADSEALHKLVKKARGHLKVKNILSYSLGQSKSVDYVGKILKSGEAYTEFYVEVKKTKSKHNFKLNLSGEHNVSNALGVVALSDLLDIDREVLAKTFMHFEGLGRRLELIGEKKGIKVYDDYAHHPTAIKTTLEGLRHKYPKKKIVCVVEPHMFSRTKKLLPKYKGVFSDVDKVIITPIFKSRDKKDFGVSGQSIVEVAKHSDITYIKDFDAVSGYVVDRAKPGDIIVVMGAGKSYLIAREILNNI